MNQKTFFSNLILLSILFFATGCQTPKTADDGSLTPNNSTNQTNTANLTGEPITDPDGFVRFPGEPTRETTNYVIIEDICGQFTPKFIGNLVNIDNLQAEASPISSIYRCSYSTADPNQFFSLTLNYLSIANQKSGHELMDRKVVKDENIPMNNYIVYQENGLVNEIYLIINDNKYISINRSSTKALSEEEIKSFAQKLAEKIKNYE